MPSKNAALALVVTAALCAAAGPATAGAGGTPKQPAGPSKAQLAKLRAATAKYQDVEKALADGYIATDKCEESKSGAMGYHYFNPKGAGDRKVDVTKPDFLLYGPKQGGGLQLNGVEYYVVDSDQNLQTRDRGLPKPLGRSFDGPMPGHVKGMPIHNDLHVWLYTKNPKGMFEPNNPKVSCP